MVANDRDRFEAEMGKAVIRAFLAVVIVFVVGVLVVLFAGKSVTQSQLFICVVIIALVGTTIVYFAFRGSNASLGGHRQGARFKIVGAPAVFLVLAIALWKIAPGPEWQHVNVTIIDSDGTLIPENFTLRYLIPGHDPRSLEGANGTVSIAGIPSGDRELDITAIQCAGWRPQNKGPFPISKTGKVEITLVRDAPKPPFDDAQRPDPSVFKPRVDLKKEPNVAPDKVNLHCNNMTGVPLILELHPYRDDAAREDPWTPKQQWLDIALNDAREVPQDGFKTGNGWFGLWARDADNRHWPLGAFNLFIAKHVQISVANNVDDKERPYVADISIKTMDTEQFGEP